MGNDSSRLKGLEVETNAVETNDFWSLYNAKIQDDTSDTLLSIFTGETVVTGQIWVAQSPLERFLKNLMIYRHPNILRYIANWEQGGHRHLATERVVPLSSIIRNLSHIQICLGLRNILSSLIFLIETAKARHLNITSNSIYVTSEGDWRLGGFEHVWKSKEVTKSLLDLDNAYRDKDSIDPNEINSNGEELEPFAFGHLCERILKDLKDPDTPHIHEFIEYCVAHLKNKNIAMRPKLSSVILHPYFNHEFVLIHSFLTEIPLKSPSEKQDFFTGLVDRLRFFDEKIVASQIGSLLLSRMVLLDITAQLCVIPFVLKSKSDVPSALFSTSTYVQFMVPKIKQIFCVQDAQIRLILLDYFNDFAKLFLKQELEEQILPQLLLGIKDTNDVLVAKTLRCLADLVPILGSAVVIGGSRRKIFADGRPQPLPETLSQARSITPVLSSGMDYLKSGSPLPDNVDISDIVETTENMPPRLSPDGGEGDDDFMCSPTDIEEDPWSDWEEKAEVKPVIVTNRPIQDNIEELDIKVNRKGSKKDEECEEIDFFKDMEPTIEVSKKTLVLEEEQVNINKSLFDFKGEEGETESGWGDQDDEDTWG
ncbi:SCYL3 family protein [Megaselia abdita]